MSQTFEGSWEEVSREAGRLAGKRVRLTILSEDLPEAAPVAPFHETATAEEWSRALREWAESHSHASPGLSDEAISRESIYGERLAST